MSGKLGTTIGGAGIEGMRHNKYDRVCMESISDEIDSLHLPETENMTIPGHPSNCG